MEPGNTGLPLLLMTLRVNRVVELDDWGWGKFST